MVLGVIPARWGSTRFPGKSLALLQGKPLVQLVWERCRKASLLDDLIVATDDERIAGAVAGFGGQAVMTDGAHRSGTDRAAEAAAAYPNADLIVNIQGDEPLIDPALIDRLVTFAGQKDWDMVTAAAPLGGEQSEAIENKSVCKVVFDAGGRALYFSRCPIPFVRDVGFCPQTNLHWRHIGVYLYRRQFLYRLVQEPPSLLEQAESLEQLRALHIGGAIGVVLTDYAGSGVDTPEDVAAVEREMLCGL